MGTYDPNEGPAAGATIGGRYVVEQPIGHGGMARVFRALDSVTGQHVALKQLRPRDEDKSLLRSRELFEREYHTLAQLAHPRIVAAKDYGVDGDLPYYTMELLDGGDLLERSPLPWRAACAFARDICSALSLVHSRRMVYRDLSPRNVRCTSDGKAKLIDFGAMAPMGPTQVAVCTPAVASPEVVYRQPLDARSDLYALGATLYTTLVGRSPYRARSFQQLIEQWGQPVIPPSELVHEIPQALDALVLDLLQLDPQLRPGSAAEVSQRLCAIAGLDPDEQMLVSQAYLSTPGLVGRERELERVSKLIERASKGQRGGTLLVRGAAGMGRSRFLDACAISAKLGGLTVLRSSPASAPSGAYGAVQAIVVQLLELMPEETVAAAAPHRNVLCALVPALGEKLEPTNDRPLDLESQGKPALRALLLALAKKRPLLVAIDDVERFDPDSRALLALLADRTRDNPLIVLATTANEAAQDADSERMLAEVGSSLPLAPLELTETQALLASIFGEVPNLSLLVRRAHAVAGGNPQHLMRVMQHLVDRGVLQYRDGAWVLPDRIGEADMPATIAQTLATAVAALDPAARALARAFAECSDDRFSLDESLALYAGADRSGAFRSLDQLVAASLVISSADGYALASYEWRAVLGDEPDAALQLRIARVFEQRGEGIRAARHLFRAGREREAVETLVNYAEESQRQTNANPELYVRFMNNLPHDWQAVFELGLALAKKHGRPLRDIYWLRVRMAGIFSQYNACSNGRMAEFGQSIARDVGLDVYEALDPQLAPGERLQRALGAAAARYAATPESERGYDPKTAITMLVRALISCVGNLSRTLDVVEWRQFPSLAPLAPLSPSVAVAERLARGFDARASGRFEQACAIYREIMALLADGNAGLEPTFAGSVREAMPGMIGYMEAVLGLPSAERCADEVAKSPLFHGSALAIRMLVKLWQGDAVGADVLARQRELWRLEQSRQQVSDVITVLWTLQAHAACDDLTRVRQCLDAIERTATKMRTWQPIAAWARGEYERIRGDNQAALAALDAALEGLPAGRHQTWPLAAAARLKVLCAEQRFDDARTDARRYLEIASECELGYVASYLRIPLSFALAKLGDAEGAWREARAVIENFTALGARGLNLGLAYEAAARVATVLEDAAAFEHYSALCKAAFLARPNPALAAKYQRLVRSAQRGPVGGNDRSIQVLSDSVLGRSQLESMLHGCSSREERLQRALQLLVLRTGAERAFLYTIVDGVPSLCASSDGLPPPTEIDTLAPRYLETELSRDEGDETATIDANESDLSAQWASKEGQCFRPVLLNHHASNGFVVAGLAVLAFRSGQALRVVGETATQISRIAVDRGDLPGFVVAV